jgi:PAS domain S-box-containing protein
MNAESHDNRTPGAPILEGAELPTARPVLITSLIALLVLAGIGYRIDRDLVSSARSEVGRELSAVLNTTAQAVEHWFTAHEEEAASWSRDPDLVAACQLLVRSDGGADSLAVTAESARLASLLAPILERDEYRGYSIVSTDGRVLAGSFRSELGRAIRPETRALVDPLLEGGVEVRLGLPQQSRGAGLATMRAAALIRGADGASLAILVLRIDPEKTFTQILRRGVMGESGESYAFNQEGKLISESRFTEDLKALGLVPEFGRSILSVDLRDPGGNMVEGHRPTSPRHEQPLTLMARSAMASGPGQDLRGYNDYRGVPVIGTWTWDADRRMGITTEIDVAEAYSSLARTRRQFGFLLGTTFLLILGMGALFTRMRKSTALLTARREASVREMITAQAELGRSEERTRTVMESATDSIICVDENERILLWNQGAEEMFGRSAKEMVGRSLAPIIPETWRAKHDAGWRAMIETGGLLSRTAGRAVRLEGLHADGSEFPIELSLGIGQAEGSMLVTAFIRDVSERVQMENEIQAAKQAAEQANQAKSAFLANMSHELRTPMNAILGYSEMLAEECEDDGNEEYLSDLGKIQTAGKHLLSLINDVLDLSKIEAGRMNLYEEDFSVTELINDVVATTEPLIAKNGNRLERDLAEDLGFAHADLTKLRQGLFNLISNASKFTKEGILTVRGRREAREGKAWLVLSVSDTGIGIPAEKLDHVFEEFAQADDSTTREYGGTGLGLPLSRRICQIMGGDLTVASDVGVGSTFTIEIPAGAPATVETAPAEAAAEPTRESEGKTGPLVLVVDDEGDARELVRRTLESEGYRVEEARTGAEALEAARRLRPDLITLDVMMPGMDGWAALRRLKADPELQATPVVMLSIVADRELSLSLGAVEAMSKPIDRDELRKLTARLVDRQGEGLTALVVEDDPPTRELLCRSLRDEGWSVNTAENGAVALERVTEELPDLILLDLMMPVMDGFEFLATLRLMDEARDVPVLVVTAKDLSAEDRGRLEAGAQQVLQKSAFDRATLLRQVASLAGPRKARDSG